MARHMGVNDKDFCPTVVWPIKLVQVLEHSCVDLELLKIKQSNKTTDFNSEYNTQRDWKYMDYLQSFTKDPQTDVTVRLIHYLMY